MATFLALVRDLARESGTLSGGVNVVTVVNATGRIDKMAGWVRKAWTNIQNEREDWPWMRREFVSALTIGQARYVAADFGLDRFAQWVPDTDDFCTFTLWDQAIGRQDEHEIRQISYDDWRRQYGRGVHDQNRPTDWAASHMQGLCLGNTPDKAYGIAGEYRLLPQVLTNDNDLPELPQQYHDAIVLEAWKLMSIADEAPVPASAAANQFVMARANLSRDYLPEITIGGGPLA